MQQRQSTGSGRERDVAVQTHPRGPAAVTFTGGAEDRGDDRRERPQPDDRARDARVRSDPKLRIAPLKPDSGPVPSHATTPRAVAELCHLLDDMEVTFPGTQMRVRYAIRESNAPS